MTKDTDEYTPDEEGELNYSSEEDENEIRKNGVNLRSCSKKMVSFSDSFCESQLLQNHVTFNNNNY